MLRNKRLLGLFLSSALFAWTGPAMAQTTTSGFTGSSGGSSGSTGSGYTGSSGGGFTGSSGGGFSGSSGSTFSGGGGAGGGSGRGGSGSGNTLTPVPASTNTFYTNYANPMYTGLITKYNATTPVKGGMGQPLYTTVTTATVSTGPGISTLTTNPFGFNTQSIRRNTPYATALGDELPLVNRRLAIADLRAILDGSTMMGSKSGIIVDVQGPVVVLRGEVASAKDRRLAEGLLRLTPGVRDVVNELRVQTRSP